MFSTLLKREFTLGWRNKHNSVLLVTFCLLSTLLFTLAIGPDQKLMGQIGVSLIWIILIFSAQLSAPSIWAQDIADGTFQQIKTSGCPLEYYVLSKVLAQWLLSIGALGLLLPILVYGLTQSLESLKLVALSFAIVSLPISFLSVTGATLTIGQEKPGLLSSTILTPFYIPLLIFSTSIHSALGETVSAYVYLLGGASLFMTPVLLYLNVFTLKWSEL